jgi:hypothetical protein
VRTFVARLFAVLFALTWLVFPGFGLIDLSVSWNPDWPVVLEAGWGVFMTVLVGGSFLAVAVRPARTARAQITLLVSSAAWLLSAGAGLEWQLLGYAGLLAVQVGVLVALLPARQPVRPVFRSPSPALLAVAALGAVPWLVYAERMFRAGRGNAGVIIGDVTMGVDHYAVQGALALALVALPLLAAWWPPGRRSLGVSAGLCAGYLGLVSFAFPGSWAGFSATWSVLCAVWGAGIAGLALTAPGPLQAGEFRREVVEAQRAL